MNDEEEWRPVVGYEGLYEVSNLGQVRGVPRQGSNGAVLRGRRIRPWGYLVVNLSRECRPKASRVHRLVLEAFDRPAREGEVARHLNGDGSNNRLENLAWGSVSDNVQDMIRHGRHRNRERTHCPRGHSYAEYAWHSVTKAPTGGTWNKRECKACRAAAYQKRRWQMGLPSSYTPEPVR